MDDQNPPQNEGVVQNTTPEKSPSEQAAESPQVTTFGSADPVGDAAHRESELQVERDEHNDRRLNPRLPDHEAIGEANKPGPALTDPSTQTFLANQGQAPQQPSEAQQPVSQPSEPQQPAQAPQEAAQPEQATDANNPAPPNT